MIYDLFRYDEYYSLLYDNGTITCSCDTLDNRPMSQRLVKIHKGVDNLLKFRVYDADRKRANITHLRVGVTLINKHNKERVLTTTGRLEAEKGFFTVTIHEGQLVNIAPGFYDFVITGTEPSTPNQVGEVVSTPFFTNQSGNIHFEAEVTDTIEKVPMPTVEIVDWMSMDYMFQGVNTKLYYSSPIPANRLKNFKEATTTFTVQGENFTGKFKVVGSLEHTAPPPSSVNDYFTLSLNGSNDWQEYGDRDVGNFILPFDGLDPWTIKANVLWIVFYWIATDQMGIPIPFNTPNLPINRISRVQVRT